jgi:putative transcriptional regulator
MSRIIEDMLDIARDLRLEPVTIKEIELLKLAELKTLNPAEIKEMRMKERVSQAVMARVFNVTASTYQKWERGEIHPKGSNLKLLRLAYDHGLNYILS